MTTSASSQRQLLVALAEADVEFILIGGHAVAAHGYERATRDVDIVYSTDRDSCARFADALKDLGASVKLADAPAPEGRITREWLEGGGHFVFATEHGPLDALTWVAGLDFPALRSRSEDAELADGLRIRVCGFEDLLAMKRAADRPRDREDIRELESIRGQQRE